MTDLMATHLYRCPLRWADMDVYGVVNNVVYLRLLEEARVDLIWRIGPAGGERALCEGYVVVRHAIEYKRPLVHRREPILIEMWVSSVQAATVSLEYEVKDDDRVYALASTTMAPYDFDRKFPRRLTDAEATFFQQFLENRRAIG